MPAEGPTTRQQEGKFWEDKAAALLQDRGIRIIERGYRCRLGELDIIGSDNGTLIIVEVKARRRTTKGSAVETVGRNKQRRIVQATRHFLMRHPAWNSRPIRFDVIAFDGIGSGQPSLTWLRNAFVST